MKKWLLSAILLLLFLVPATAASGGKRTKDKAKKQGALQNRQPQQQAGQPVNRDNCAYLFMELEDGTIIVVRICW